MDLNRVEEQIQSLREYHSRSGRERDSLQARIQEFQASKTAQEKVVREVLGYLRPDEILIEFE